MAQSFGELLKNCEGRSGSLKIDLDCKNHIHITVTLSKLVYSRIQMETDSDLQLGPKINKIDIKNKILTAILGCTDRNETDAMHYLDYYCTSVHVQRPPAVNLI
jgi:hypothetical protein